MATSLYVANIDQGPTHHDPASSSRSSSALNDESINVQSSLTPEAGDGNIAQRQMQPRSGILTVTLHEGVDISLPEDFKHLLEACNDQQDSEPTTNTVFPTPGVNPENSNAYERVADSCKPEEVTSKNRTNEVYAILEVEKSQVLVYAYSGTNNHPRWTGNSYKFDVVSHWVDLSVHLYLKNALSALNSERPQDLYLGVARFKPTFEEDRNRLESPNVTEFTIAEHNQQDKIPYQGWLEVQDSTGKIRASIDFEENKTQLLQIQDFEMLKLLGKSSSGRILQVRKKGSGQLYALKEIRKTCIVSQDTEAAGVFRIAKQSVLHQVENPFLVPIKFIFQSPESLYFVSAFVPSGELFDMLYKEQCFDMDTIRLYTAEILCALECLHDSGVICGDLKPQNILLDYTGHIYICDFGLCKLYPKDTISSPYLAPEIMLGHAYTEVVDWFTLGILLAEMLTQLDPSWYYTNKFTSPDVKISSFYFPDADFGLSPAQDLSIRLFNSYPEHRLGANGIAEIKAHPFLTNVDWQKILKQEYEPVFKPKEAPAVFDTHPQDLGFVLMSKEEAQELSDKAIAQWHA